MQPRPIDPLMARGLGLTLLLAASVALAQAPVGDLARRDQAIQRSQQAASTAYREMRQAEYESTLAEQDVLNSQDAHDRAQKHAADMKRQLEEARKALDAARAREAQARRRYDEALKSVDRAFAAPPAAKK